MTRRQIKKRETSVDIVIAVYNRFDLLEQCLDSIPDAVGDTSYNIIIVDNNSDKEERIKFYASREDIILIQNQENVGFPKACNQGAKRGSSPYIFFLNSDVILEPNSVNIMLQDMKDNPMLGIVGMLLVFPEYAGNGLNPNIRPPNMVQHVGMDVTINGRWIHTFVGWNADNPKVLNSREVYAVTGAALLTKRQIWNTVGGFLEDYGGGTFEDVDYCMSVRDLGYNIIVETRAKGTHYTGATSEFHRIGFPIDKNRFLFMQRWSEKLQWSEFNRW